MRDLIAVDFETKSIEKRPEYPPIPVGVVLTDSRSSEYLAWGHPSGNNCDKATAGRRLREVWRSKKPIFHNSKFDVEVGNVHFGLRVLDPDEYEDTLFLAFLHSPRALDLGLKPISNAVLGMPPKEQDKLREWILKHVDDATEKTWGSYISEVPGNIVTPYAKGDGIRTFKLFKVLHKHASDNGMLEAYYREKRLMPVLLRMESHGIKTDTKRLKRDVKTWENQVIAIDKYLIKKLGGAKVVAKFGGKKDFNIGSSQQLAKALEAAGLVDDLPLTAKGNKSTKRDVLKDAITDPKLSEALAKRTILLKYLSTYVNKWIESEDYDGYVYPSINQVRNNDTSEDRTTGARTGRLSYSDSWQAIPKPDRRPYPDLPNLRDYVIPDESGMVINHRDYCFSNDTEVLTDGGWKLFQDLHRNEKLAQWKDGQITFAHPTAHQKVPHKGQMIRVLGKRFVDLLVSPNHRCLYLDRAMKPNFITADCYPIGGAYQLHAGKMIGGQDISEHLLVLICAVQADAKVESGTDGWRAIFSLKKKRKIERLITCLRGLKISYDIKPIKSKPGFTSVRIAKLPKECLSFIKLQVASSNCASAKKVFSIEALLKLRLEARQFFLFELGYWDGSRAHDHDITGWSYGTTSKDCADVVQAIAAVSDFRVTMKVGTLPSKKKFYGLGFSCRTNKTMTDTFTRKSQRYDGFIYCVTMPWSTVIVRRNGRVMITGQSQQEFRILAHYENGPLLARYQADPTIDMHDTATDMINTLTGMNWDRRPIKDIGFGLIYGMGLDKTAKKTGQDIATTKMLRTNYMRAIPGLPELQKEIKDRCAAGDPIRTWGGRLYWVEEPKYVEKFNREMTFEYKMLNVLVQGSAGDCTKEAIILVDEAFRVIGYDNARILITVHDEINSCVRKSFQKRAMQLQKEAMESIPFDVKMLSDGKMGPTWGSLKKYKD